MFNLANYIEALADKEHASWARWHRYVRTLVMPIELKTLRSDITIKDVIKYHAITDIDFTHWNRLAETDYADLSEYSKESDRREVRELIEILHKIYNDGYEEALINHGLFHYK